MSQNDPAQSSGEEKVAWANLFDGANPLKLKLKAEVDSWRSFSDALRFEDRQVLRDMIQHVWQYADAIENSKEGHTTEAFLISLLLFREKTILFLEEEISRLKEGRLAKEEDRTG